MPPRLPDLVRQTELETQYRDGCIVHLYHEYGGTSRERTLREVYWKHKQYVTGGGYGSVWLEECTSGNSNVKVRAVKKISTGNQPLFKFVREMEAIAVFSHRKV